MKKEKVKSNLPAGKAGKNKEAAIWMAKAEEYLEGWKRTKADFANYKKQEAERRGEVIKFANQDLILALLPVLDNFESAYKELPDGKQDDEWAKGIGFIKDQLEGVLREMGVEEIPAQGTEFDPELHEAVEKVKDKNKGSLKVIEVVRKGFKLGDKVIRVARVKVG